jgi:hypothetical protein
MLVYKANKTKNDYVGELLWVYAKSCKQGSSGLQTSLSDGGLGQHRKWGLAPLAGEGKLLRDIIWMMGSDDNNDDLNALELMTSASKRLLRRSFM